MPKALHHSYANWTEQPETEQPENLRVVSAKRARKLRKRARKLRKRGVRLIPLHAIREVSIYRDSPARDKDYTRNEPTTPNGRAKYAWLEPSSFADERSYRKSRKCYEMYIKALEGKVGRKYELAQRLQEQRNRHLAKIKTKRWIHEVNPQLASREALDKLATIFGFNFKLPVVTYGEFNNPVDTQHNLIPEHWTDEQKRQYLKFGYVTEIKVEGDPPLIMRYAPHFTYPSVTPRSGLIPCVGDYVGHSYVPVGEPEGNSQRMACDTAGCTAYYYDTLKIEL